MKLAASIILHSALVIALAGCAVKSAAPPYNSAGSSLSKIQSSAADAKWVLGKAQKAGGPAKAAYIETAVEVITNIQQYASDGARELTEATKRYWAKVKETDWDHEKNKWFGWQTRHYWYVFLSLWAIAGVVGIVAQFVGLGWLSKLVFRFLPFSNPFAFVRDWIQKRKDAGTPTVNITIQNPEAVRASATQVADAIDAAGPATVPDGSGVV